MKELNLIAGNDELREVLKYIKVTKEKTYVTNTFIAAIVPTVELFNKEFISKLDGKGILIHSEDWKKFKGSTSIEMIEGNVIKIHSKKKRPQLIEFETEKNISKYPSIENVFNDNVQAVERIGLNPKYLYTLSKGLGFTQVRLSFNTVNTAIKVHGTTADEPSKSIGIIMPVAIN